jgi:hypothetical protein
LTNSKQACPAIAPYLRGTVSLDGTTDADDVCSPRKKAAELFAERGRSRLGVTAGFCSPLKKANALDTVLPDRGHATKARLFSPGG